MLLGSSCQIYCESSNCCKMLGGSQLGLQNQQMYFTCCSALELQRWQHSFKKTSKKSLFANNSAQKGRNGLKPATDLLKSVFFFCENNIFMYFLVFFADMSNFVVKISEK